MLKHCLVALATAAAALAAAPARAQQPAGDYPSRPVKIVVAFAPGQSGDILARTVAESLARVWGGKPVVVENRPGAGGAVGAQYVARSAPDGYTLLLGSTGPVAIAPQLVKTAGYDPHKDFTPVAMLINAPQIMVVTTRSPYKTVQDVIDDARRRPGQLSYGTGGVGSMSNLTMEILNHDAGLNIVHVPYRGAGPAYTDLLAGRLQVMFDTAPAAMGYVKAGQMRFLAVSSIKRLSILPDVPTLDEAGVKGFDANGSLGILGPAGLPPAIVEKLNQGLRQAVADPRVATALTELGFPPEPGSPEQYRERIDREYAVFAKAIKEADIHVE